MFASRLSKPRSVEPLETRVLLSGPGSTGDGDAGSQIFLNGTESDDQIVIVSAAGGGADVFINGTLLHFTQAEISGMILVANSLGGDDDVSISAPLPTRISVLGGAGDDALTVNGTDSSDELDLLTDNGVINGVAIDFQDVEQFRLNARGAIDLISLFQTNADMDITIDAQDGDDNIQLFSGSDNTGFAGDAHLIGGVGDDRILVGQSLTTPSRIYTVSPDRISGAGPAEFTYEQVEQVQVEAGVNADVLRVTPSVTTEITIDGGGFIPTAPADTLELLPGGATGVTLIATGAASGRYTFADRLDVNFLSIESLPAPDTVFPTAGDPIFLFETSPHAVSVAFSEPVQDSIDAGDLVVTSIPTGDPIQVESFDYDPGGNVATFLFPGVLPDGNYHASIAAADITDAGGNPLASALSFDFFFLNGDANHDGRVNVNDFTILASNFGQSNRIFSQGDFNYDGVVNVNDFTILASRFGTSLAPAMSRFGRNSIPLT